MQGKHLQWSPFIEIKFQAGPATLSRRVIPLQLCSGFQFAEQLFFRMHVCEALLLVSSFYNKTSVNPISVFEGQDVEMTI